MTVALASPRAKSRWLILTLLVLCLSAVAAGIAVGHGVSSIPGRYTGGTQVDIDPPPGPAVNDQPGQVDMTQMGRDTSVNPNVRIFWSWDAISAWTGTGQTGDACALFDNDNDGKINYVVCARVNNPGADPTITALAPAATDKPAFLFDCSDAKVDRCTQPTPRNYTAGQVVAGPLAASVSLTQSGAGNLQNETDPFNASFAAGPGEAYPHDSSLEIQIDSALVPTGARLANVCSYPSAGNGGNNNPFDCIVTPGVQYGTLRVQKLVVNDHGGSKTFGDFRFTAGSGASTSGVIASTAFDGDGIIDTQVPVGTYSVAEVGTPISGYTTSYSNCSSVSVSAGGTTTCTITNNDDAGSLQLVKRVVNDNGGTATVTDFSVTTNAGALTFDGGVADGANTIKYTSNARSVAAGSYSLVEANVTGYSEGSWNCSGGTANPTTFSGGSVSVANGATVVCTITNNDEKATPGFATDVDARIRDNTKITGRGTPSGSVDFFLYSDSACSELVGSDLNVALTNGEATSKWFDISSSDTYYWQVHYDGDQQNEAASGACGEAITIQSADFASVLTAAGGFALPILAWALWSRRRRENAI